MNFAAPWFLAGLVALGIPLYVHLLRQFDRTPQAFPSLRFFERRVQSATKSRKLRYLTLLALRLALFALLALAFADPFVSRLITSGRAKTLTVVALDRSFSIRAGTRVRDAKAAAHAVVNSLPRDARAQIVGVDSHLQAMTQPTTDRGVLHAAIDAMQPGDDASSYGEFARALRILETSSNAQLDVRFVTDAQQTSMPSSFSDLQLGGRTLMHVMTVGRDRRDNWAVISVDAPATTNGERGVRIVARVASWNAKPEARHVALLIDGKVIAGKDVTVPDCGQAQAQFENVQIPYGAHRGEIRITPSDQLPEDDSYVFAIEHIDRRSVLFLYAHGRARQAVFYSAALSSANTNLNVVSRPIEDAATANLSQYAFIVLNDPGTLSHEAESNISSYVTKGGAAFIAVGPDTARTGTVALARASIRESGQTQSAEWLDSRRTKDGAVTFGSVEFLATPMMNAGPESRVMAKFSDGTPLLIQAPAGQGRILLFASTLDNENSDFPVHPSFLPFVAETARTLTGDDEAASSYTVGAAVALRQNATQSTAADVVGPGGNHELSLTEAAHTIDYRIERTGYYDIRRADGRRLLAAANSDRRESDLSTVAEETLALWGAKSTAADGPATTIDQQTEHYSLWPYVLLLALLAAIAESIFSGRYLKQERLAK